MFRKGLPLPPAQTDTCKAATSQAASQETALLGLRKHKYTQAGAASRHQSSAGCMLSPCLLKHAPRGPATHMLLISIQKRGHLKALLNHFWLPFKAYTATVTLAALSDQGKNSQSKPMPQQMQSELNMLPSPSLTCCSQGRDTLMNSFCSATTQWVLVSASTDYRCAAIYSLHITASQWGDAAALCLGQTKSCM